MTRRAQSIVYALLLAAAASAAAVAQDDIVNLVKKVRPVVVTVITYDSDNDEQAQGSGFFVDARHVITDWHVVDEAARVEVKDANGKVFRVKSVAARNQKTDLAKLELVDANNAVQPLPIAATTPEPGERVVVVGSPLGLEASISDGVVSGVRDIPGLGRVVQISAPISRGSSGSPVVNMKGEVIGVAQAIRGGGQNLNFAIPSEQVLALNPDTGRAIASTPSAPSGQGAGPETAPTADLQTGLELFRAQDYERALPYFLNAAKADPKNHIAWFLVGHSYVNMGRYTEAAAAFARSVQAKPDFVDGYCSLGAALGLLGQHEKALIAFDTALKIAPSSSVAHYGRALTYLSLGQGENAMKEYRVLQRLDPELAAQLEQLVR